MKSILAFVFACVILYPEIGNTQNFPIQLNQGDKTLRELLNPGLQQELESTLYKNEQIKSLLTQKRMAVGLVDLSDLNDVKFARINGNEMMYAASLPKIAVLLASMEAIEAGQLEETEEVKSDMKLMISKSNNQATTRMIDRIGFEKIEDVMTCERYELYNEDFGGGIWVGKRYAAGGETNREPMKHLSHAATATQVCRFYYLLLQGKLVNEERSKQMLDIMEEPAIHHKFVYTLDKIAPQAHVYRKSGTWESYHADSVLVWGPKRKYILVGLVQDYDGERILRDLVNQIDTVLHEND